MRKKKGVVFLTSFTQGMFERSVENLLLDLVQHLQEDSSILAIHEPDFTGTRLPQVRYIDLFDRMPEIRSMIKEPRFTDPAGWGPKSVRHMNSQAAHWALKVAAISIGYLEAHQRGYSGLVWMDADSAVTNDQQESYREVIKSCDICYKNREPRVTCTSLLAFRCCLPVLHFVTEWMDMYRDGTVHNLRRWGDHDVFDHLRQSTRHHNLVLQDHNRLPRGIKFCIKHILGHKEQNNLRHVAAKSHRKQPRAPRRDRSRIRLPSSRAAEAEE